MSDFAQTVKQQADIVKVIEGYIRLRNAGAQRFKGLCPFHKEKTPSFNVNGGSQQFFYCFGCQASGDVFSFVGKIENVGFPEAVRIVAQKCGIPLPKREFSSPEEAEGARLRAKLLDLHETAAAWFEEQMRGPEGALAREYLAGRGLDPKGIKEFRIGYAPDSFNALRDRLSGMADEATLRSSGLFSSKEQEDGGHGRIYDRFRKRVVFPISNESGRVIAFTARTLGTAAEGEKAGPKYVNSPETPLYSKGQVLFNLDKAKAAIRTVGFALLVEGQMDCISVFLRGIQNVIATSGTAFTEQQVAILRRHTQNVVVNFDPDAAGANAAQKSIDLLVEEGFNIKIVTLEGGLDPDRFIREQGLGAYSEASYRSEDRVGASPNSEKEWVDHKKTIRGARWYADYLIDRARQMFPGTTAEQKLKAMNFLLPHIRRIPEMVARDQFAADAAQKLGIDSAVLREELRQAALRRRDRVEGPAPGGLLPFERFFIEATCNDDAAPKDYDDLHEDLKQFDKRMKNEFATPEWQRYVLPNLPSGLFERLASRKRKQDIEATTPEEEQRTFLRRVFSESSAHPRIHRHDRAIIKDLEVEALRWSVLLKRAALEEINKSGDLERGIELTQRILGIERYLRTIEDEKQ